MKSRYETKAFLDQYLLFHYGSKKDQSPFNFSSSNALNFPVRCVSECVNKNDLPANARALDLGCAVGRSTFEFSRFCQHAVGVDNSHSFIQAAQSIQKNGHIKYSLQEEGSKIVKRIAKLSLGTHPARTEFRCMDVMELIRTKNEYHVVLAANLICRLADPHCFLEEIHNPILSLGQLVIVTPYSWSEEFTPRSKWLKGAKGITSLKNILKRHFELKRTFDMPFIMREHLRKYQWGNSQASIWIKR